MALPPKIGVFDSGIGGLSVLREIHHLLPAHPTVYVADQANLPYGPRPISEIQSFTDHITRFLIAQGCVVIVIACNTASAASLEYLRAKYPQVPFVGMEPAIKPALEASKTGVVGMLSTRATAEGTLYKRLLERYAEDKRVITQVAPELVRIAEEQSQHTAASRAIIADYVWPMMNGGADQIVLACTHFPFLADAIQEIAGEGITLVDPSPAVARQTARLWPSDAVPERAENSYYTSGDVEGFQESLKLLTGVEAPAAFMFY
ncbi:MAG: glutamate racemase [Chloroflexi bacterium]|nr:glutamate racemase [Chloroflexota bacterium]MCC6891801.1 glutamate racemase [Anaerolineae bacterium]